MTVLGYAPASEAELCDLFTDAARADGFDVYPEVGGFDLLIVWRAERPMAPAWRSPGNWLREIPRGYQVGVDAKLRANVEVLDQAVGRMDLLRRPDEAAVLVPEAGRPFRQLAGRLGLRVFTLAHCAAGRLDCGVRRAPAAIDRKRIEPAESRCDPIRSADHEPLPVPPFALQSGGGRPHPRVLSPWRVAALRLCLRMRDAGFLTREDFKDQGMRVDRWVNPRWVESDGRKPAKYTPAEHWELDGPHIGYERELEVLRQADAASIGRASG